MAKLVSDPLKMCIELVNLKPDSDSVKPVVWCHCCLFTMDYVAKRPFDFPSESERGFTV